MESNGPPPIMRRDWIDFGDGIPQRSGPAPGVGTGPMKGPPLRLPEGEELEWMEERHRALGDRNRPGAHSPPSFGRATGEETASGAPAASSFLASTMSSERFLSRESMDHLLTK